MAAFVRDVFYIYIFKNLYGYPDTLSEFHPSSYQACSFLKTIFRLDVDLFRRWREKVKIENNKERETEYQISTTT